MCKQKDISVKATIKFTEALYNAANCGKFTYD